MAVYIVGNGTSRRRVCLDEIKRKGIVYGCNALYKDLTPDFLIATDYDQSHAIQMTGYAQHHEFYTREPYTDKGAKKLKKPYANWGSGPNAIQLAVNHGHTELYIVGFDFGSSSDTFNNVYAGHEFYKSPDEAATFGGNWCKQVETIVRHNPKVHFNIAVSVETDQHYTAYLKEFENVKILSINEFLIHINNV